ncbi:Leucine-rich repeat protein [Handroanthus impetiginosus]|uniref:Leucine-rich repeat protein n=1 Tax=Handroanthus impetiginosus TaxID=429701 RepID=A0A2G9HBE5_9LAMI|nr:Leucine-rich repeat protein [Handroanthus impetiginosus]
MINPMKFFQLIPLLLVSLMPVLGHSPKGGSASKISCLESERQALFKFKDELVDTHGRLSSWGDGEHQGDCCKWKGVHCHNRTNHVIRLDLHNPGYDDYDNISDAPLKGKVSASLLELQHLQYLNLSFNDFGNAPIPEFIGSLSKLRHLDLYHANFGGRIPHHLGNLSKLLYLDLGYNQNCYSENLDWVSHLYSLEYLDLSFANLSKATNWLQAVSKLNSIEELRFSGCKLPDILSSSLPSNASAPLEILYLSNNSFIFSTLTLIRWFSNFSSTGLTDVDLSYNNMSGPIPDVFANMTSLSLLDLSFTGLEGGIPKYFGNMSNLLDIDLSWNNLTGELSELMTNLSGPLEQKLQSLSLVGNMISGSFSNMSRFSSLKILVLAFNQLNGCIQGSYIKLPHLLCLHLYGNQFIGPVPDLSFSSSLEDLDLSDNKFNGTLAKSIGRLSQLKTLDLSLNSFLTVKFNGHWVPLFQLESLSLSHCRLGPQFPSWLKTQKKLIHFDISNSGISDNFPSWFGGVAPKLKSLNASNNQMYGVLPNFSFSTIFGDDKRALDLSRNKISGPLSFLCHSREWKLIDLSNNLLGGQIPDCFTHFKWLEYLNLANNSFSGMIPHSFGSLRALSLVHLRNNSFSGELPTSMGNCTKLRMIDFGENRLTGKIPTWIGNRFSELKVLVLRFNRFYGSIPSSLCGLANIQILDVSSNEISGVIPNCVHKYIAMTRKDSDNNPPFIAKYVIEYPSSVSFEETGSFESTYFMWKGKEVKYTNHLGLVRLIDLSNNNLVGVIPWGITKLVGLIGLNLSTNNLSGSIPRNIGELKSLNFLDFSRNHLLGSIPTSIGELTHLGVLNLSYNNLSGKIPPTTQLLTFSESSYMGNSGLCGLQLNKSCPRDESHQDSGNNEMSNGQNDDDEFISEGFYIALGLGFVVGFWGIFGTILLNKAMQSAFVKVSNIVEDFVYVRVELTKARLFKYFKNG